MKRYLIFLIAATLFLVACTTEQIEITEEFLPEEPAIEPIVEEVIPTIIIIRSPPTADKDAFFKVDWKIESESPLIAVHTAIHYDTQSHPGEFGNDITPEDSGYPSLTKEFAQGTFPIPDSFSATIPSQDIKMYFRAHTIVDGKHYWTKEKFVNIVAPFRKFTIAIDEKKVDPETITVNKGDRVKIYFQFNDDDIYFGGLDVRSDYFSVSYDKGKENNLKAVEFIAENSFTYTGYWPRSNKRKASGKVEVK